MPQGLQIWDENGVLKLDVTSRLGILLGFVNTNKVNGSLLVQGFERGTPFFFANLIENISGPSAIAPRIYTSGNTIYWVYDGEQSFNKLNTRIFYGVY